MLAMLSVVSGVRDAVSYRGLGHVFVANMTGNVVFLGFADAGASQLSVPASLTALAGFCLPRSARADWLDASAPAGAAGCYGRLLV